ncbi:MAG: hypothetical protein WBY88_02180, partial [Desulfosarcina sp.]
RWDTRDWTFTDRMAAMLSRLGGRGYQVQEEQAGNGNEVRDFDPDPDSDSDFDLDQDNKTPQPSVPGDAWQRTGTPSLFVFCFLT